MTFFANYLIFFDDILIEFFRDRGVTFRPDGASVVEGNIVADECWFIGEVNCKYHASSAYDDLLEISIAVERIFDKKAVFCCKCSNLTANVLSAEGSMTLVYFGRKLGRSVRMSRAIVERIQ